MTKGLSVGIFLFSYPLGISDVVTHTARKMAELGHDVEIFVDEVSFSISPFVTDRQRVRVTRVPLNASPSSDLLEISERWRSLELFLLGNSSLPRFPLYLAQVLSLTKGKTYSLLIGVEPFGLITAYLLRLISRAPLLYYNMELFQRRSCHSADMHRVKQMEIEASRDCAYTLIQDEGRGRLFRRENEVDPDQILFLPVSTSGPPITKKSDYFRKIFDLPAEKKIIIYAGHIIDWAMCKEIVRASGSWPEDYVLVMNSWKTNNAQEDYFKEVQEAAGSNVFLNTDPIPPELFPEALSSADVGLMFYKAIDENFTEIGSSSNKLAHYLQAGLPVVASRFPSVQKIFDKYGCGLTVPHPEDLATALAAIFDSYESYHTGARRAFQDHYDFDRAFSPIQERIGTLLRRP